MIFLWGNQEVPFAIVKKRNRSKLGEKSADYYDIKLINNSWFSLKRLRFLKSSQHPWKNNNNSCLRFDRIFFVFLLAGDLDLGPYRFFSSVCSLITGKKEKSFRLPKFIQIELKRKKKSFKNTL